MATSKTYPYTPLWTGSSMVKKPMVEIELTRGTESMKQMAVVDSGADITTMNAEIAGYLGIDLSTCEEMSVGGILGNPSPAYATDMEIRVSGFDDPIMLRVLFVPDMKMGVLLGQEGFFDQFHITFDKGKDLVKLTRK